jgi:hypothetical protein
MCESNFYVNPDEGVKSFRRNYSGVNESILFYSVGFVDELVAEATD